MPVKLYASLDVIVDYLQLLPAALVTEWYVLLLNGGAFYTMCGTLRAGPRLGALLLVR